MTVSDRMTGSALVTAKAHVSDVCNLGDDLILIKPGTTDELGHILTETTLALKAHPVRYTPFTRDVIQRISWVENMDILFYVAKLDIDTLTLTLEDIQQYQKVRHDDKEYEIKYVDRYSSFGDDCLYIIIGANK